MTPWQSEACATLALELPSAVCVEGNGCFTRDLQAASLHLLRRRSSSMTPHRLRRGSSHLQARRQQLTRETTITLHS